MDDNFSWRLTGDQARVAIDASRMAWFHWDFRTDKVHGNARLLELSNLPADAGQIPQQDFFASVHEEDIVLLEEAVEKAALEGEDFDVDYRVVTGDDGIRWLAGRGRVSERSETGKPRTLTGVIWDITRDREYEDRLEHLAMEMSHRVKNAFSVVSALAQIGGRSETDVKEFSSQLSRQIKAMGDAHHLAIRYSQGDLGDQGRVLMRDILSSALAPWQASAPIRIDCPEDFDFSQSRAAAFAMLVYELATNSAKYGGLGAGGEGVDISAERIDGDKICFRWCGRGGEIGQDNGDESANVLDEDASDEGPKSPGGFGTVLVRYCLDTLNAAGDQSISDGEFRFDCVFPEQED